VSPVRYISTVSYYLKFYDFPFINKKTKQMAGGIYHIILEFNSEQPTIIHPDVRTMTLSQDSQINVDLGKLILFCRSEYVHSTHT
jgi:hypothetical protein